MVRKQTGQVLVAKIIDMVRKQIGQVLVAKVIDMVRKQTGQVLGVWKKNMGKRSVIILPFMIEKRWH